MGLCQQYVAVTGEFEKKKQQQQHPVIESLCFSQVAAGCVIDC